VGAIDGKEYAAKRGRSPVRKIANNNEGARGAKSTASTPPPAHERKKTKRAIQTVPKAAGTAASSSLRYSDAQTRRTVSPPEY
jgi:predicted DNA-binding transcriptional regulator YafY